MSSELAMGLNIIHLIFFFPKYTYVYSIEWDLSTRTDSNFNPGMIQLSILANILPILLSSLNLKMSYICFLEEDSKWILLFGLVYIPLNWVFLYTDRTGLEYFNYPFLDWQNEELTFLFLFGQALFQWFINNNLAWITKQRTGFNEFGGVPNENNFSTFFKRAFCCCCRKGDVSGQYSF